MAGEIQLNSTTMATESSGSITAELDTIRPNTTNGSLVLQGDNSNAGVTGLTIDSSGNATFAQTITDGTLGSSVVFPAGTIIKVSYGLNDTASAALSGTQTSLSLGITTKVANSNFLIFASGNASLSSASSGRLFLTKTISATETEVGDFGNLFINNANAIQGYTGMWTLSPSLTASASLTLKVKVAVDSGNFRYNVDYNSSSNNAQTSITVFEYM